MSKECNVVQYYDMNIFRHKAYKVELKPTSEQIKIIERTMGVCRYVYNLFIATNLDNYRNGTHEYMSGYNFSKWLNNNYRKANDVNYGYGKYRLKP